MLRLEAQGRGNRRVVCGTRHGQRPSPVRQCRYPALLRGVSAPGVEAVEVQDGVQHHRIASPGFAAIDRVNGEQHDVAFARGRVHHGGALGDLVAALDQAGDEQVLAVGVAENHARPEGWRNHAETVAFLFVQHRPRLPGFGLALFRDLDSRSEEHTSELQSRLHLVCRLLLEKKKNTATILRMLSIDLAPRTTSDSQPLPLSFYSYTLPSASPNTAPRTAILSSTTLSTQRLNA